jgi:hypothetical protein
MGKRQKEPRTRLGALKRRKKGRGRVDADAHEDENRRHNSFIKVHTTPLSNKNVLEACEKKRIHVGQQK